MSEYEPENAIKFVWSCGHHGSLLFPNPTTVDEVIKSVAEEENRPCPHCEAEREHNNRRQVIAAVKELRGDN